MTVKLDENTKRQIKDMLTRMEGPVTAHLFLSQNHCLYCNEVKELMDNIVKLAPKGKLKLEACECDTESEKAKKHGIDKHPAVVLEGKNKGKVRTFGIMSGYEFGSFIEDIVDVSRGETGLLSQEAKDYIKSIDKPVHIQVFVTPTCPFCPGTVRLDHAAAMINPNITGDMIEAMEFHELSEKYKVFGVPKMVINEEVHLEGAPPEGMFIEKLKESLS
ncbi:MAG: thioredoxin family protein [Candidatus Odinarchaeota archaeon]